MKTQNHPPVMFSLPIHQKLELPKRADILPKIESGELEYIDFQADVFGTGKIRNPYRFKDEDLESFGNSFEGQPFLRNHDTYNIESRDGTIVNAENQNGVFKQTIRLTTRRGMTDFVEGKIDRFSIGWYYDDIMCSICNSSWFDSSCPHWPGREYETSNGRKQCVLIFINPTGKETSAVNTPAVEGTGITALHEYKLEINGGKRTDDPARGGKFLSAYHPQGQKGEEMTDQNQDQSATLTTEQTAALELQGVNEAVADLQEKNRQANDILLAQCRTLLDQSLAASKLPAASQKAVAKPFETMLAERKPFTAVQLQDAIKEKRDELAELTSAQNVQGPGRVQIGGMFNTSDQLQAAMDDLLGAEREPGSENLKVARLSGIREAYILATGDRDFFGGYFPEFALVSANFPVIVKNAMNKVLAKAWNKYGEAGYDWWKYIATVEHFTSLQDIDWMITGTISSLPEIDERGSYQELPIGDNGEESAWQKYGGYVPITLETMLRDDTRALRAIPGELALAGIRNISEQIAALFTVNAGAGPTLSDGGALFNATAVTTAGGHANLLTTALGTDYTAWNAVATAVYNQPMHVKNDTGLYGTGKKQAIEPTICLVPRQLKAAADALFLPRWASNVEALAAVGGPTYGGMVRPVVVPEWTDATDFAAVIDPALVPGVMLGEIFGVKPQLFTAGSEIDPAMFSNDESRIKTRQFLAVGIANWRALHKSNVAG